MQSPTKFGATDELKGSAEAAAVVEEDTVSDRGFFSIAFHGGGGAASWTAEAASHLLNSPLSSIRRSVLEKFPTMDTKEGRRRIRNRSQIFRVADARL